MATLEMLWESTDAESALRRRFGFAGVESAAGWLEDTLLGRYDVRVRSVDRLVISAVNLIGWLSTDDGPLVTKCCSALDRHPRLVAVGELLQRLDEQCLPVSVPVETSAGAPQARCGHLSVGVQRVVPGKLLDPADLAQARAAGVTLARLHAALACYPDDTLPIHQPVRGTPVVGIKALLARVPIDRLESKAATLVRALRDRFDDLGSPGALPAQLVHDDYRAANILWDAGRVSGVLDFDEVGVGARVAEVARAAVLLGTRFRHWSPLARDSREAFLAGYGACQPLTGAELDWLPALMAWHSIGSDLAGPYDPQWLDSALELSNEI